MSDLNDLILAAKEVRTNAYAKYSVYQVGAAILGANGKIYKGCNIENISYGLTICAERSAVSQMVADGCQEIKAVAVVTKDGGTPCGMCRQFLVEFAPQPKEVSVVCVSEKGDEQCYNLEELIPHRFDSDLVKA